MSDTSISSPNSLVLMLKSMWRHKAVILAAVLTLVTVSVLVKLGLWQLSRGYEKQELEHQLKIRKQKHAIDLDSLINEMSITGDDINVTAFTGVKVSLRINPTTLQEDGKNVFLLDNQTFEGNVGYIAYQLVLIGQQERVVYALIDLGFVKASRERSVLPSIEVLTEEQEITGRLYVKSMNPLSSELGLESTNPYRIQNLNFGALSERLGVELFPLIIQPTELDGWANPFIWVPANMSSSKHFGYSVQWFVMALVLSLITLRLAWKQINTKTKTLAIKKVKPTVK
ncbi:SURF1 family protein [Vibrio makurazakiensis]|uniref:SURF1 family protein n=1 Tax=Vibrio makurazakiensis TaxID=2910250 RepID=UPI003D09F6B7